MDLREIEYFYISKAQTYYSFLKLYLYSLFIIYYTHNIFLELDKYSQFFIKSKKKSELIIFFFKIHFFLDFIKNREYLFNSRNILCV